MKNIKLFLVSLLMIAGPKMVQAQKNYFPIAITSNGMCFEKTISMNNAQNLIALNLIHLDNNKIKKINIPSYKITIVKNNKDPREFECKSEVFSAEIKAVFKNINTGDKIYFEYIKGENAGTDLLINPLVLEVI